MTTYKGVSVELMLQFIGKKADVVHLDYAPARNQWRLYVQSPEFGEYEQTGALAYVVIQAFKPYEADFHNERERARATMLTLIRVIAGAVNDDKAH